MGSLGDNGLKIASKARGMAWRPRSVLLARSRAMVKLLSTYPSIAVSCSGGIVTSASFAFQNGTADVLSSVVGIARTNLELSIVGSHLLHAAMAFARS